MNNILESYYGKQVVHVTTKLKDNEIKTTEYLVRVWNPAKQKMVRPADGCDVIIHDSSTNSKNIFEIGGVDVSSNDLGFWGWVELYNYCKPEEVEQVKLEHLKAIKKMIIDHNNTIRETLSKQESLLKTLNTI